jgi:hypothetical protein
MHLLGSGVQGSAGRMGRFQHFNRAMTSAERTALFQAGVAEVDRGASQVPVYTSNFSAGVDGWVERFGTALTGNIDAIGGEDDWLEITATGTGSNRRCRRPVSFSIGARLKRIKIKIFVPSTNVTCAGGRLRLASGAAADDNFVNLGAQTLLVPPALDTVFETVLENTGDGSLSTQLLMTLVPASGSTLDSVTSGDKIYIKAVEAFDLGNTVNLSPTGIQLAPGQWLDSSGNKSHVHLPGGTRLLNPATQGQVRGTNVWAASDTLQYVNNVNAVALPTNIILTLYAKATVSGTFDLGDGSDQDRYGAGVTIGTTWAPVTTLLPTHDGTNRKLTVKPTSSYSGTVETTWRVEVVA